MRFSHENIAYVVFDSFDEISLPDFGHRGICEAGYKIDEIFKFIRTGYCYPFSFFAISNSIFPKIQFEL